MSDKYKSNVPKLLKRIWERLNGDEARGLHRTLLVTKSALVSREDELAVTQDQLSQRSNELALTQSLITQMEVDLSISKHSRDTRLHPYVSEALEIASKNINVAFSEKSSYADNVLKGLFTKHGSDKESRHSYSLTYSELLKGQQNPHILEIGLGSLNGFPYGGLPPGGSIKAWREAYPTSLIVGADIDEEAVASISEIGFVVDQTSDQSLDKFVANINEYAPFDLVVDDGFHDPHANLRTLLKVFPLISDSGAYVIEDIHNSMVDLWQLLSLTIEAELEIRDLSSEREETDDNILLIFRKIREAI